jgi:hypothetical protein
MSVREQQQCEHVRDACCRMDRDRVPEIDRFEPTLRDDQEGTVALKVEGNGRATHPDREQAGGGLLGVVSDEEDRQRQVQEAERVVDRGLEPTARAVGRECDVLTHLGEEARSDAVVVEPFVEVRGGRDDGGQRTQQQPDRHQRDLGPEDRKV